jgi:hypothetical protein
MSKIGEQVTVVAVAIIGVAILAVLVSRNSQTSSVIGALGQAFNMSLGAALRPVTGSIGGLGT